MRSPEDRPGDLIDPVAVKHRGRTLPIGMTLLCFEEMEELFRDYERGDFGGFASDAAIRAFEIAHRK